MPVERGTQAADEARPSADEAALATSRGKPSPLLSQALGEEGSIRVRRQGWVDEGMIGRAGGREERGRWGAGDLDCGARWGGAGHGLVEAQDVLGTETA